MSTQIGTIRIRTLVGGGAVSMLLALLPAYSQADSLLYENGPDNFPANLNAKPEQIFNVGTSGVGFGAVSEDFTLNAAASVDRVVFEELTLNLNTSTVPIPATVKWCIGSSFFACNLGSGTSTLTSKAMGTQSPFFNFASTLSLSGISLSAGKYYLTLGSATDDLPTTPRNNDYWGARAGTTGDGEGELVSTVTPTSTFTLKNEPSFEVYGTTTGGGGGGGGVPEPQTLLLLMSGLASLALPRRRVRRGWSSARTACWSSSDLRSLPSPRR